MASNIFGEKMAQETDRVQACVRTQEELEERLSTAVNVNTTEVKSSQVTTDATTGVTALLLLCKKSHRYSHIHFPWRRVHNSF